METITIKAIITIPLNKVWTLWTQPDHVCNWNFASTDWHCPKALNNLVVGGEFHYTMAAKDGSFEFDFWGTFAHIEFEKKIAITLGDGRMMEVLFEETPEGTTITEIFEPEKVNSIALQEAGWQAILNNFKLYAEK